MNDDYTPKQPDLHLHNDPQLVELESLLDKLGDEDQRAMPEGLDNRVLDAISSAIAPGPISIKTSEPPVVPASNGRFWSLRLAAAAVLATGTTLVIVGTHPWSSWSTNTDPNAPMITLSSLETDLDEYLELESVDDGGLSQAVTDWEIWAQSVNTEIDSSTIGYEISDSDEYEGAL